MTRIYLRGHLSFMQHSFSSDLRLCLHYVFPFKTISGFVSLLLSFFFLFSLLSTTSICFFFNLNQHGGLLGKPFVQCRPDGDFW